MFQKVSQTINTHKLKPESEIDKQEAKTLKEALMQNTKDKTSL